MVQAPTKIKKLARLVQLYRALRYSGTHATSLRDFWALFYLADLKPSLVFRGLAQYHPAQKHSVAVKVTPGKTYEVVFRDNGLDIDPLLDFYSPHTAVFPPHLLRFQPKVIYDIGANIGIASLFFSSSFPSARIYAFEPVPANFELCELNLRKVPLTRACPWAVGSSTGTATFECQNDPRGGRLQGVSANPHLHTLSRIDVQVFTIQDLVRRQKLEAPDFLKIDVEGSELDVLNGLGDQLESVKRIAVETHGPELKAACLRWMQEHSFRLLDAIDKDAIWAERG